MIDEIDIGLKDRARRLHRARRQAACGHVQGDVGPLGLEGSQRKADLAQNLKLHVQRVQRVLPGRVRKLWPDH